MLTFSLSVMSENAVESRSLSTPFCNSSLFLFSLANRIPSVKIIKTSAMLQIIIVAMPSGYVGL